MQSNQCAVANSSLKSSSGANKHSKANAMLLAMLYPLRVLCKLRFALQLVPI